MANPAKANDIEPTFLIGRFSLFQCQISALVCQPALLCQIKADLNGFAGGAFSVKPRYPAPYLHAAQRDCEPNPTSKSTTKAEIWQSLCQTTKSPFVHEARTPAERRESQVRRNFLAARGWQAKSDTNNTKQVIFDWELVFQGTVYTVSVEAHLQCH